MMRCYFTRRANSRVTLRPGRPTGRERLGYFREFRLHWPNLLGATLALALGLGLKQFMLNLLGPPLLAEFGWSKAEFALIGSFGIVTLFFSPFVGRFADRFGTRVTAAIGLCAIPAGFLLFSRMSGSLYEFYAIDIGLTVLGLCTASFILSRAVVERFDHARGIALAVMLSGSPLVGALAVQWMGDIVADQGWRAACRLVAAVAALGGVVAFFLMGRVGKAPPPPRLAGRLSFAQFKAITRTPVFLLLLLGMFFCNFQHVLVSSQMNLMLMDKGTTATFATGMVSLYAITVVAGRFAGGFALDRIAPHHVAIVALGLPVVGYLALASSWNSHLAIGLSIALVGLAQGAETDVSAILTSRKFAMENYSFIFSLLMMAMSGSSALGSIVLSITLHFTDSFAPFLVLNAAFTAVGALCFFLTGRFGQADLPRAVSDEASEPLPGAAA